MSDAMRAALAEHLERKGDAYEAGEGCIILLALDVGCAVVALDGDVGPGAITVGRPSPERLEELKRAASGGAR